MTTTAQDFRRFRENEAEKATLEHIFNSGILTGDMSLVECEATNLETVRVELEIERCDFKAFRVLENWENNTSTFEVEGVFKLDTQYFVVINVKLKK